MRILITNQPHTVFPTVDAAEAQCPGDDDDHNYVVQADPKGSGWAIIQVYDAKTGDFIGNF